MFSRPNLSILQREAFEQSLENDAAPPEGLPLPVAALWWVKNRNWHKAHELIDSAPGQDEAWVHAFLHRMEGDQWNANYWYTRAGRDAPETSVTKELEQLLAHFLS